MSTDSVHPDSKYGTEGVCESGMVDPRSKTHTTKSNAAANGKLCNPLPADVKPEAEQVRGGGGCSCGNRAFVSFFSWVCLRRRTL